MTEKQLKEKAKAAYEAANKIAAEIKTLADLDAISDISVANREHCGNTEIADVYINDCITTLTIGGKFSVSEHVTVFAEGDCAGEWNYNALTDKIHPTWQSSGQ